MVGGDGEVTLGEGGGVVCGAGGWLAVLGGGGLDFVGGGGLEAGGGGRVDDAGVAPMLKSRRLTQAPGKYMAELVEESMREAVMTSVG